MNAIRRHISFLLLGLLLLMQLPVRFLHLGHEEGDFLKSDSGAQEALSTYSPACDFCDLVFPPVIQVLTAEVPLLQEKAGITEVLNIPSIPFLSLEGASLRAPPLV